MNLPGFSVRNPVTVNLLMWALVLSGIWGWTTLVREFFPEFETDRILVTVAYPGATPEEVERTVARRLEREIEDVSGIEEVQAQVAEGVARLVIELEDGADSVKVLAELRSEVDRAAAELPEGTEDPEIRELTPILPVIQVVAHGTVGEEPLREVARRIREDLLDDEMITEVLIMGRRPREVHVEVRPGSLREHGLTFEAVGRALAAVNRDLPGGQLQGASGNVRVRTRGERDRALPMEGLIVGARPDGAVIRLADVARVREGFEDLVEEGSFRGEPAAIVTVFKKAEQDAVEISRRVKAYVARDPSRLGGAVRLDTVTDLARFIEQRLDLMIRNARIGMVLVVLALALFLELEVAFWVALGLPVSFLGTFLVMRLTGQTINLISLFALILVLGMIVDDAIVVGERVFTRIRQGEDPMRAAEEGTLEVALPVLAAVLTTIVAFVPLGFMDGVTGTFMRVMPQVAITALLISLIECFLILPAHLARRRSRAPGAAPEEDGTGWWADMRRMWNRVGEAKHRFVERTLTDLFERVLRLALAWRYVTLALVAAVTLTTIGLVQGGVIPWVFIQKMDAENLLIDLEMAAGTHESETRKVLVGLERMALEYPEVEQAFSILGAPPAETLWGNSGMGRADTATVGHVNLELVPADTREARGMRSSDALIQEMRVRTRDLPALKKLSFRSRSGAPEGPDIELRVRGPDLETVAAAVAWVREEVSRYAGVVEVEDDLTVGKREVRLLPREALSILGLTVAGVGGEVRHAVSGFEVQDLQHENEEVKVRVLLPEAMREEIGHLEALEVATPDGHRVPLGEVVELAVGRGYAMLRRVDGKRAVTIRAEVDETRANVSDMTEDLAGRLAGLGARFPGVSVTFEGRKKETRESVGSLEWGFPAALVAIYFLIAMLFRSYTQPLIVMVAIPYSLVGAVLGHLLAGYPFTMLSMVGSVALAGIVVNDSLILVDFINRTLAEGDLSTLEAVVYGARARMRAILLTSVTTVLGLAPLMIERSYQAQFLIPMAVSVVYGLAFATALTLVVIPVLYLCYEDLRLLLVWLWTGQWPTGSAAGRELP